MSSGYKGEGQSDGGFFTGVLIGTAIGAGLAVLFAPKAGAAMREDLREGIGAVGKAVTETWEDVTATVSSAIDKGREAYEQEVSTALPGGRSSTPSPGRSA